MRDVALIVTLLCALWPVDAAAQNSAADRIRRAQTVFASNLDPTLPNVPAGVWLREVLGSSAQYEWTSGSCVGQRGDNVVPLCAIVAATDSKVAVIVGIRLGEYLQDAKVDRWGTPQLDEAFISVGRDLLMLDRLSDLPRMLNRSRQEWPRPDIVLESARCVPERPQGYESVTCRMELVNNGSAPALGRVFVDVEPSRLGGDLLVKLPIHSRRTVRMMFHWPDEEGARVSAGVELDNRSPYHRVNERGELTLTRGEDLNTPDFLLGWEDDDEALKTIVSGRLSVGRTPGTIDVPVDRSITRLVVSVELSRGVTATLLRPDGARVGEMDADVTFSDRSTIDLKRQIPAILRVYTITSPQPGVWQASIQGSAGANDAAIIVKALGRSPIDLTTFRFVRLQEGVHGGYFTIDGMPLAGSPATAEAGLWHGPKEATFRLVDENGTALANLPLRKGNPNAVPDDFVGTFELPTVPFHIVMNGVDESGAPIQRQYGETFRAQPVALFFDYGQSDSLEAGTKRRFTFAVTNVGSKVATFDLNVSTNLGKVLELSPATVTVEPGTSATPTFLLAIPSTARHLDNVTVRMTATNTADPAITNTAEGRLEVASADDADDDSVDNDRDNCREVPNNDQADTNHNGIGDACDTIFGEPLSITRLSPESGPPGSVVKVTGTGFSTTSQYFVLLGGQFQPVLATAVSATELVFTVPVSAPIGPVPLTVATEHASSTSPMPFIVRRPSVKP